MHSVKSQGYSSFTVILKLKEQIFQRAIFAQFTKTESKFMGNIVTHVVTTFLIIFKNIYLYLFRIQSNNCRQWMEQKKCSVSIQDTAQHLQLGRFRGSHICCAVTVQSGKYIFRSDRQILLPRRRPKDVRLWLRLLWTLQLADFRIANRNNRMKGG